MKRLKLLLYVGFVLVVAAGCATAPIVPPTYEELSSASRFKSTLVVTQFSESDSNVQGVSRGAFSLLQSHLSNYFNLIDQSGRTNVDIHEGEYMVSGLVKALDRKSTRLNSSHSDRSRMPSSA